MAYIREYQFDSSREGMKIHTVAWLPSHCKPVGVIQLCHGIAEYIHRYDDFAHFLTDQGFAVVGNDHLGHGQSYYAPDQQGFFAEKNGWNMVVEDMYRLYTATKKRYPTLPYILFGHSMGSFLARTFIIQHPDAVDACILSGTGQQSYPLYLAGKLITSVECLRLGKLGRSPLANALCFGKYNDHVPAPRTAYDWLTRDDEVVSKYVLDPGCGFMPTASLLQDMMDGLLFISNPKNVKKMKKDLPVYFISGSEDPVGDYGTGVQKAAHLMKLAGCTKCACHLYSGARHEILNEFCKEDVYKDVIKFIKYACPGVAEEMALLEKANKRP